MSKTKKLKTFRVYVDQVNQTFVDVKAKDAYEAAEKGYLKWRKDCAHSEVSGVTAENGDWTRIEQ